MNPKRAKVTQTKIFPFLAAGVLAAVLSGCGVSHTGDGVIGGAMLGGIVGGSDGAALGAVLGGAGGAVMDYDERARYQEHQRRMREREYEFSRPHPKAYGRGPYYHYR